MNEEHQLIHRFYTHFQEKDWRSMLACYQENILFYDPVFENREGAEVRAMWEMLLKNAKDLELAFSDIESEDGYGSCHWVATYTFSRTGRKVVNRGKAFFKFSEGRIAEHQDDFDLWHWCRMAMGTRGLLLGWTPLMQNRVRSKAGKSLQQFMAQQGK